MHHGTVKNWVEERGFGFVTPDNENLPDQFVHISHVEVGRTPRQGDRVTFQIARSDRTGKDEAQNVRFTPGGAGASRQPDGRVELRGIGLRAGGNRHSALVP